MLRPRQSAYVQYASIRVLESDANLSVLVVKMTETLHSSTIRGIAQLG